MDKETGSRSFIKRAIDTVKNDIVASGIISKLWKYVRNAVRDLFRF